MGGKRELQLDSDHLSAVREFARIPPEPEHQCNGKAPYLQCSLQSKRGKCYHRIHMTDSVQNIQWKGTGFDRIDCCIATPTFLMNASDVGATFLSFMYPKELRKAAVTSIAFMKDVGVAIQPFTPA